MQIVHMSGGSKSPGGKYVYLRMRSHGLGFITLTLRATVQIKAGYRPGMVGRTVRKQLRIFRPFGEGNEIS